MLLTTGKVPGGNFASSDITSVSPWEVEGLFTYLAIFLQYYCKSNLFFNELVIILDLSMNFLPSLDIFMLLSILKLQC